MTIRTSDVVAPVFTAPEIITFFLSGMARQTCFRYFFR